MSVLSRQFGHLDVGAGSGKDGRRLRGPVVSLREREQLVKIVGFEKSEEKKINYLGFLIYLNNISSKKFFYKFFAFSK